MSDDAGRLELVDRDDARVSSRTGQLVAKVEVTDAVMPRVVSLPHGWGHDVPGTAQGVASVQPRPNSNVVADEMLLDVPSGNAVLNGIPVEVAAVKAALAL